MEVAYDPFSGVFLDGFLRNPLGPPDCAGLLACSGLGGHGDRGVHPHGDGAGWPPRLVDGGGRFYHLRLGGGIIDCLDLFPRSAGDVVPGGDDQPP